MVLLCRRLLGVFLQGFAKGPDGGRDAKFVGTAELHPSRTVPWFGTTTVQAKHTNDYKRNFSEPRLLPVMLSIIITRHAFMKCRAPVNAPDTLSGPAGNASGMLTMRTGCARPIPVILPSALPDGYFFNAKTTDTFARIEILPSAMDSVGAPVSLLAFCITFWDIPCLRPKPQPDQLE